MADLIDRDAAIKKFIEGDGDDDFTAGYNCAVDEYRRKIAKIPAVNIWIPCKERLPEQDREVLVCCYGSDLILTREGETLTEAVKRTRREIVRVTVGFLCSDGWYGADLFPMMVFPTYWMPLPEPPEKE